MFHVLVIDLLAANVEKEGNPFADSSGCTDGDTATSNEYCPNRASPTPCVDILCRLFTGIPEAADTDKNLCATTAFTTDFTTAGNADKIVTVNADGTCKTGQCLHADGGDPGQAAVESSSWSNH